MCNYRYQPINNCPLLIKNNERKSTLFVVHDLKIYPKYFSEVVSGKKKFEIRDNTDRSFNIGDTIRLREWDPNFKKYTGLAFDVEITYISIGFPGIPENISILSIEPTNQKRIYQYGI